MDLNTLQDGLTVMCLGVSIVFCFLLVLIFSMGIMSKIVAYLDKVFPVAAAVPVSSKKVSSNDEEEIAVAITAAIMQQAR